MAMDSRIKPFQEVCGAIDELLIEAYDGDRPLSLTISLHKCHLEDKVLMKMVEESYTPLGWDIGKNEESLTFYERLDSVIPVLQSTNPYR